MIKLEHVKKQYKEFGMDCSMQVRPGCVTGLIGPNGAGKSTTFKAILGLISCDSGRVQVLGKPADKLNSQDRQKIGTVLADSGFSGYLDIRSLVPVLASMYPAFHREQFLENCRKFDLPLDKKIKEFSTGMKRKLQVLAAISHEAQLLILDEPTAGMDVLVRDEIIGMLRGYMETDGRAVLISSHIASDLEGFCDDLYMIQNGKIIFPEDTDVLLDSYALLKMTQEQYDSLDKHDILRYKKEPYGVSCLTSQKRFYMENYPQITVEKGNIDELILMMARGEKR